MKDRGKDDGVYVLDILAEIANIESFVAGMGKKEYLSSPLVRRAVERSIQIIGEASRGLSGPFRQKHSEVEWGKIIAMRNIITHAYGEVDHETVWEAVGRDVPELKRKLAKLKI